MEDRLTARIWQMAKNLTLNVEGGYQCDPDDKGNWTGGNVGVGLLKGTKYGISAASFSNVDIKNLTKELEEKTDILAADIRKASIDFVEKDKLI